MAFLPQRALEQPGHANLVFYHEHPHAVKVATEPEEKLNGAAVPAQKIQGPHAGPAPIRVSQAASWRTSTAWLRKPM
jgi:hypothetical protein